nr:hypothetical protein [Murinocardiopsis flavida]
MGYAARLRALVTSDDVGRRVTLRVLLSGGVFSDIVGVLESWEHGVATVRRRDGTVTEVITNDIAASKVVPQEPARRPPR